MIPTRGPAPKERDGHFSCVYKSKLYVIGGRSLKDPNQLFSDVVSLDLSELGLLQGYGYGLWAWWAWKFTYTMEWNERGGGMRRQTDRLVVGTGRETW